MALLRARVAGEVEHAHDRAALDREQQATALVVGVALDHRRDLLRRRRRVAREQHRQPLRHDRGDIGVQRVRVGR